MSYLICFILLFLCIILGIALYIFICKNEELEDELNNAETRAVTHFRKVNKIERILKYSNDTKENYFITLDKINRVIYPLQTNR